MPSTYEEALEMVLSVIAEMQASPNYDSATLEELRQRIA
jgi:hypothetical protein